MANILVVDDELGIRDLLGEILNDEGHHVDVAENATQARQARLRQRPDLVLLDIWMPDTDGVSLLKEWSTSGLLTMPVIMMSGHATIDTAVEATRIGALAFLEKPITLQKLLKAVELGLSKPLTPPLALAQNRTASMAGANPAASATGVGGSSPFFPASRPGGQGALQASASSFNPAPYASAQAPQHATFAANTAGSLHSSGPNSGFVVAVPIAQGGPQATQSFDLDKPLREARDAFEKAYFEFHLACENGSMTRVAEKTGLERTHLYRKLKQLGVSLVRSKRS